MKMKTVLHPTL